MKKEIQTLEEKIERKHGVVQSLTAEKQQLIDVHQAEKQRLAEEHAQEKQRLSADFQREIQDLTSANDRLLAEKQEGLANLTVQEERHKAALKTLEKKVNLSSADAVKLLREDVKTLKERLARSVETGEMFERQLREREKELTQCRDEIVPKLTSDLATAEAAAVDAGAHAEMEARKAEEAGKLAEKRKSIIDEMAIRAQKEADQFTAEMAEVKGKLEETRSTLDEKKTEARKKGVEFDKLLNKLAGERERLERSFLFLSATELTPSGL